MPIETMEHYQERVSRRMEPMPFEEFWSRDVKIPAGADRTYPDLGGDSNGSSEGDPEAE